MARPTRYILDWWLGQLAGLVPGTLKHALAANVAIIEIGSHFLSLSMRTHMTSVCITTASQDDAGMQELARAIAASNPKPPGLVIHLAPERVLKKRLSLPLAARSNLKTVLGFAIDRETPFAAEEVYWGYAVRGQEKKLGLLEVDLFVVPHTFADPFVNAARRAGLTPAAIEITSGPDSLMLIPLAQERRSSSLRRPKRQLALLAASTLALVGFVAPFIYQEWALASADSVIASLEPQAREAISLRRSADETARSATFLEKRNGRDGAALSMLAATTRLLPDTSHLTAMNLRDGRLTLSGLSPAAAELVSVFAQSRDFSEPAFDAPVVQSGSGGLEAFTISVNVGQRAAK